MIRKDIPHYFIDTDNNEDTLIDQNLNFAVAPYLEKLSPEDNKIFNSLDANEARFSDEMRKRVLSMLNSVRAIIVAKLRDMKDIVLDENYEPTTGPSISPSPEMLIDNYERQLKSLNELSDIFYADDVPIRNANEGKYNPRNKQVAFCYQLQDDVQILMSLSALQDENTIKGQINLLKTHLSQLENSLNEKG
jgi:hypothetical protein